MNEIAGMHSSEHRADSVFFWTRPNDGFVVSKDNLIRRDVRRV
jgi:hypothetical protein